MSLLPVRAVYGEDVIQYQPVAVPAVSKRPSNMTFGWVLPDYDTVWVEKDVNDNLLTLKRLDRNSRSEILLGKKQGSGYNAASGKAVPATARFSDDTPAKMPCDLQWWLFDLNKTKAPSLERAKADWASCFRDNAWITNNTGTWTRQDCINENGLPPYLQAQPMMCGGSVYREVGETSKDWIVEAINPDVVDYQKYTPEEYPWLFFTPKLSARVRLEDAKGNVLGFECWYEEPMHFFGERMQMAVFGFIPDKRATVTGYVNRLPKFRGRRLGQYEAVPNPYIMRDGRQLKNPYEGF
jgi:hypothetical protein